MYDDEMLSTQMVSESIENDAIKNKIYIPTTNEELKEAKREVSGRTIKNIEKMFVLEALARNDWNVTKAAKETGMQRTNFQALMKKYNITSREYLLKDMSQKDV
jgi:transcriptional regulator with GAF, ATPase, and Fis domain